MLLYDPKDAEEVVVGIREDPKAAKYGTEDSGAVWGTDFGQFWRLKMAV